MTKGLNEPRRCGRKRLLKHRACAYVIRAFQSQNRKPPSRREIATMMQISLSDVQALLVEMSDQGVVRLIPAVHRGIILKCEHLHFGGSNGRLTV